MECLALIFVLAQPAVSRTDVDWVLAGRIEVGVDLAQFTRLAFRDATDRDPAPLTTVVGRSVRLWCDARLPDPLRERLRAAGAGESGFRSTLDPESLWDGLFQEFQAAVPMGPLFEQARAEHDAAVASLREAVRVEAGRVLGYCRVCDPSELGRWNREGARRQLVIPNLIRARCSPVTIGETLHTFDDSGRPWRYDPRPLLHAIAEPLCFDPAWRELREESRSLYRKTLGGPCATLPEHASWGSLLLDSLVEALDPRTRGDFRPKLVSETVMLLSPELDVYERGTRTLREDWPRILRALARAARG